MRYLDLTLPTPAENLALDEALLDEAEAAGRPTETLRIWEPAQPMVVIGHSSRIRAEVQYEACRREGVPVLRRASGGAAVVAGPGCLMYALVLSYERFPAYRAVDLAHRAILGTIAAALRALVPDLHIQGTSDLALGQRKFSGNSMRCKRTHLLYHGTVLYDFPLDLLSRWLAMPPRQPAYREGREHLAFVTNLPLIAAEIRPRLVAAWDAAEPRADWPRQETAELVRQKYGRPQWNQRC